MIEFFVAIMIVSLAILAGIMGIVIMFILSFKKIQPVSKNKFVDGSDK